MIDFIKKNKIITVIAIVLIITGTFFILFNNKKKDEDFFKEINDIDKNINSGFYLSASEQLDKLILNVNKSKDAMIFLKRAYKLASAENYYNDLSVYADNLNARFKNNIEISAVNTFAKQKTRNYKKAFDISKDKLSGSDYRSLYYLSVLKNGMEIRDKRIKKRIPEEFFFLFDNIEITSEVLLNSAELNYDDRYYLDAALLYLKEGLPEEALSCINRTGDDSYNELKMYIAYDNENFISAEKYFRKMNECQKIDYKNLLAGCDILLRNGKYIEAAEYYKEIISENKDESGIPFRNLYSLERNSGAGYKWLGEGMKKYPDSENLVLPYLWEIFISQDEERIENLQYFDGEDKNDLFELFEVNMLQENRSPEYITGSYWNLYNKNPQSESVAVAFAGYLLKNRQYGPLAVLIKKYNDINGMSDWAEGYAAVMNALEGKYEEAIAFSESALTINYNYRNLYNHAVINELFGRNQKAIELLEQILEMEETNETVEEVIGKTYYKLAEIHYNLNEKEIALNYIKSSIDNGYNKLKCGLLMRRIQEEYND